MSVGTDTLERMSGGDSGDWADQPVQVNVDGVYSYGEHMRMYGLHKLIDGQRHTGGMVDPILTGLTPAGGWGIFAEGVAVANRLMQNQADFTAFLKDLASGIVDIGHAAMAVAASYNWTDVENSADINAVSWAFTGLGDRPGGYPTTYPGTSDPFNAKTVQEEMAEAQGDGGSVPLSSTGDLSQAVQVVDGMAGMPQQYRHPGDSYLTYVFADGSSIVVSTKQSGSTVTTTTTAYDASGKQIGSQTETKTVSAAAQVTKRVEHRGSTTVTTTVTLNADGTETIETDVDTPDPVTGVMKHSQTITTVHGTPPPAPGSMGPVQQAEQDMDSQGDPYMIGNQGPGY